MSWVDRIAILSWLALTVPTYVIGKRRRVPKAWLAFIPIVGSLLVPLLSMNASPWWLLCVIVPVVLLVMLAVMLPRRHGRSQWWTLGIVIPIADVIVLYAYAFTLSTPIRSAIVPTIPS
jgi:cytochrome bd-type quinol oxidase subunit 2